MYPVTQDFLDKMKADRRQVLARVVIDYTDPFMDQSIEIETSEQANVSYPQQTVDSVDTATHKWASLDGSWVLDGTFALAPPPDKLSQYQFGWWGKQLAGAGGAFSAPYPTLTVMHLPRPVHTLRVVGDTARVEYPVDFEIKLYGPDDTLLKTETVTGNTQVNWSKTLAVPVLDVAKQVLEITRWSHEGRQAKIIEFFTSIREVYETGDLVSIRLLEEREASQGSLPVGNISSNEITLALNNESKKFDIDNENSPLKNLLKPNRRIQAWLGAEAENLDSENPPTFTRNSVAYLSDGTQVAANVPRFEQGEFGQAVLVEEDSTNLANYSDPTALTQFAAYGNVSIAAAGAVGSAFSGGAVFGDNTVARYAYPGAALAASTTYTVSVFVRMDDGGAPVVGTTNTSGDFGLVLGASLITSSATVVNIGGGLYRVSATATTGTSPLQHFGVVKYTGQSARTFKVSGFQVEQKSYATGYVKTTGASATRSPERLTIPTAGVMDDISSWSIEFWGKQAIVTNHIQGWFDGRWTSGIPVSMILNASKQILIYCLDEAGNNLLVFIGPTISTPGDWHYYAITYSAGVMKIYFDGAKIGEVSTTLKTNSGTNPFRLGYVAGSSPHEGNVLIDDLRISSIARSDEEILAAYEGGKPLPVDEWTTYKLSFDGHLYRNALGTAWVPLGTFWSLDWDSPDDTLEATVTARDRMELLRKSTFQTSRVLQNKSLYELAEIVLQDAGLMPEEYIIDPALHNIVVPYSWFNPVSHREALRLIAEAGLAAAFQNRDGKIQIESFLISGDEPVLEITEDDYFPPLRAPSRQDQVANEVIVDTQPLRPATTPEEVYRSNEPITIPGNSTKTVTAFYNKTPVIDAAASLDNPPAGVSITEATYYGWGASIKIANNTGTDQQVTLVIQGKPLTVQGKERVIVRDEASITENGVLTFEFPANPLVQTLAQAQAIADTLLASVKDPRRDIEVEWRGNPALLLGDRVTVKGKDYHVIRQEIEWTGALSARLTGRRVT